MYTAQYCDDESIVWKQNIIQIITVLNPKNINSNWNNLLNQFIENISTNNLIHWAIRLSVIDKNLIRTVILQYQKIDKKKVVSLIEPAIQLNFLSEGSVIVPNNMEEYNKILDEFSQFKYWMQPFVYEWNGLKILNQFRISNCLPKLIKNAISRRIRLDYQINCRPYSLSSEECRSIQKNIVRIEEEESLPETIKYDQLNIQKTDLLGNLLIEEFVATNSFESSCVFSEIIHNYHAKTLKNYGFPRPDFSFQDTTEYDELIQTGLHSSLAIPSDDIIEKVAMISSATDITGLFHLEKSHPNLVKLFKNSIILEGDDIHNPNYSIVRILALSNQQDYNEPKGAGFLVSSKYVITCAHVIADALNISRDKSEAPSEAIYIDFPLLEKPIPLKANVIKWFPVRNSFSIGDIEDIAILELSPSSRLPRNAQPASILVLNHNSFFNRTVRMCGFPVGFDDGDWLTGTLQGIIKTGQVQLKTDVERRKVAPGFSGTPIWDKNENAVLGIMEKIETAKEVVEENVVEGEQIKHYISAYMIPASIFFKAWSELEQYSNYRTEIKIS
jgi:hypothetical protein